jgi:hypothetical protein
MARERLTRSQDSAWRFFYLPLIVGLVIGAAAATATDQWWWAAVGVGAAVGEAVRRSKSGRSPIVSLIARPVELATVELTLVVYERIAAPRGLITGLAEYRWETT